MLMLNSEDRVRTRRADWSEIPELWDTAHAYEVVDAWTGEELGCVRGGLSVELESHDVAVLVVGDAC